MDRQKKEKLKKTLCAELERYADHGNMSKTDLDMVHLLSDTIKNIDKIDMLEEGSSYGEGMYMDQNSERRTGSYGRDSYGRGEYVARGTYGRGSYGEGSYGRDSYGRGSYGMAVNTSEGGKHMMTDAISEMLSSNDLTMQERETLTKAMEIFRV